MLTPLALTNQSGLDAAEGERLAFEAIEIITKLGRQLIDYRQGLRDGLVPEWSQLAQKDVHGHRTDAIEGQQSLFQVIGIGRHFMQPLKATHVLKYS